jgi:hypothetical protein
MHSCAWLVAILLLGPAADASDWKYAGRVDGFVGFYDAAAVVRDGARVRFWLSLVPAGELAPPEALPRAQERYAAHVEAAARKIASGYVPPLLDLPAVRSLHSDDFEAYARRVATWEAIANDDVYATDRQEYELDCDRNALRTLQTLRWDDDDGSWRRTPSSQAPRPVAPKSNLALLAELLCPRRSL